MLRLTRPGSLLSLALLVVGCSAGYVPSESGSSGAAASQPGSSSGTSEPGEPAVEATALDLSGVTKVQLSDGVCGGAPGVCHGSDAIEVDVANATVERSTCVAQGKDPATGQPLPTTSKKTQRALGKEELSGVLGALSAVRFTSKRSTAQDGYMIALTVTSNTGTKYYSPQATCGQERFQTVVAGFDEVKKVFQAL